MSHSHTFGTVSRMSSSVQRPTSNAIEAQSLLEDIIRIFPQLNFALNDILRPSSDRVCLFFSSFLQMFGIDPADLYAPRFDQLTMVGDNVEIHETAKSFRVTNLAIMINDVLAQYYGASFTVSMKVFIRPDSKCFIELAKQTMALATDVVPGIMANVARIVKIQRSKEEKYRALKQEVENLQREKNRMTVVYEEQKAPAAQFQAESVALANRRSELQARVAKLKTTDQSLRVAVAEEDLKNSELKVKISNKEEEIGTVRKSLVQSPDKLMQELKGIRQMKELHEQTKVEKVNALVDVKQKNKFYIQLVEITRQIYAAMQEFSVQLAELKKREKILTELDSKVKQMSTSAASQTSKRLQIDAKLAEIDQNTKDLQRKHNLRMRELKAKQDEISNDIVAMENKLSEEERQAEELLGNIEEQLEDTTVKQREVESNHKNGIQNLEAKEHVLLQTIEEFHCQKMRSLDLLNGPPETSG